MLSLLWTRLVKKLKFWAKLFVVSTALHVVFAFFIFFVYMGQNSPFSIDINRSILSSGAPIVFMNINTSTSVGYSGKKASRGGSPKRCLNGGENSCKSGSKNSFNDKKVVNKVSESKAKNRFVNKNAKDKEIRKILEKKKRLEKIRIKRAEAIKKRKVLLEKKKVLLEKLRENNRKKVLEEKAKAKKLEDKKLQEKRMHAAKEAQKKESQEKEKIDLERKREQEDKIKKEAEQESLKKKKEEQDRQKIEKEKKIEKEELEKKLAQENKNIKQTDDKIEQEDNSQVAVADDKKQEMGDINVLGSGDSDAANVGQEGEFYATSDAVYIGQKETELLKIQYEIEREVAKHWSPPEGLSKDLSCTVNLAVDWNGKVSQVKVVKGSGILIYDVSARVAASKLSMPNSLYGKNLNIVFNQ